MVVQTQRRCGGTFTDLLLINEEAGATFRVKVRTTPVNQAAVVLDGIERVCASAGIKPSALTELMHSTTATTNAVLEGKGTRVELVTTEGYRQILQVASSYVPGGLAGWIVWPSPSRSRRSMTRWKFASGSARGRGRHLIADKCLRNPPRTNGASARSPKRKRLMAAGRGTVAIFDFGAPVEELRRRCLDETGLPTPVSPRFTRIVHLPRLSWGPRPDET